MRKLKIPHDAFIVVGDGRKALFLRNQGDEVYPHFKVERVLTQDNPATREQGADRPTRVFQSADGRRSGVEQTDWHDLGEKNFARDVATALESAVRSLDFKSLIVVAPARTLAELRAAIGNAVKARIIAEVDKDLTKHPVHEIEKHLAA